MTDPAVGSKTAELYSDKNHTNDRATPINCWECIECGREPGGLNAELLGTCPAATESTFTGRNRGLNGGRICWRVAGTFCLGAVHGSYAAKLLACSFCDFYQLVQDQEGDNLRL